MSDDLVKRLRDWCSCNIDSSPCMAEEECRYAYAAADRIEELEAQRKKTYEALLNVTRLHDEVEAKLAKAVGALKHAKMNMPHPDQLIDDTLAELTGGKDE